MYKNVLFFLFMAMGGNIVSLVYGSAIGWCVANADVLHYTEPVIVSALTMMAAPITVSIMTLFVYNEEFTRKPFKVEDVFAVLVLGFFLPAYAGFLSTYCGVWQFSD